MHILKTIYSIKINTLKNTYYETKSLDLDSVRLVIALNAGSPGRNSLKMYERSICGHTKNINVNIGISFNGYFGDFIKKKSNNHHNKSSYVDQLLVFLRVLEDLKHRFHIGLLEDQRV